MVETGRPNQLNGSNKKYGPKSPWVEVDACLVGLPKPWIHTWLAIIFSFFLVKGAFNKQGLHKIITHFGGNETKEMKLSS